MMYQTFCQYMIMMIHFTARAAVEQNKFVHTKSQPTLAVIYLLRTISSRKMYSLSSLVLLAIGPSCDLANASKFKWNGFQTRRQGHSYQSIKPLQTTNFLVNAHVTTFVYQVGAQKYQTDKVLLFTQTYNVRPITQTQV